MTKRRTRVLITGSREWSDRSIIRDALNRVYQEFGPPVVVVHGAARGADSIAHQLAVRAEGHGVFIETHRAKWDTLGRSAGMVRNQLMVDRGADICLAFIKDHSPGATNCALMAERAGIPVRRYIIDSRTGEVVIP